jgi:ferrous iron transport protein B
MSRKDYSTEDIEFVMADKRYEKISDIVSQTVKKEKVGYTLTDLLDRVFLNKWLGIPIFLILMWGMFQITFDASAPLMDLIELAFGLLGGRTFDLLLNPFYLAYMENTLGEIVSGFIADEALADIVTGLAVGSLPNQILTSFTVDGVIGGLGAVLVFIPPIFFLFLAISLLEDSGYLARAAFVMDRAMEKIGLHGRSFIPMLLGFGCNIPAIMATRSIEDEADRKLTILVNPLMSCSARLPVYVLFAGAFFATASGSVIFSMYILGITLAVAMALLFRKVFFKGKPSAFIMELPTYKMPTLHGSIRHMWDRGYYFLRKAGTIIFLVVALVWALSVFPWGAPIEYPVAIAGFNFPVMLYPSIMYQLGQGLEPLVAPLGFDWRGAVALLFGFLAKEVVVGTYGVLLAVEGTAAIAAGLQTIFTPLTAVAFMAFTLIYVPCVATLATIKAEMGSWKWTAFTLVYLVLLAYGVALAIIGIGNLLGFGGPGIENILHLIGTELPFMG